jgi:hypothetical protein
MRYVELFEERTFINGTPITLLRNPVPSLLMFFTQGTRRGISRGIVQDNDVVYWDACKCTHAEVQTYLGLPVTEDGFDVAEVRGIRGDTYRVTCREQFIDHVLGNANVRRSLNDPAMHFIREDGSEIPLGDQP